MLKVVSSEKNLGVNLKLQHEKAHDKTYGLKYLTSDMDYQPKNFSTKRRAKCVRKAPSIHVYGGPGVQYISSF